MPGYSKNDIQGSNVLSDVDVLNSIDLELNTHASPRHFRIRVFVHWHIVGVVILKQIFQQLLVVVLQALSRGQEPQTQHNPKE
jgi:hypothetical protein